MVIIIGCVEDETTFSNLSWKRNFTIALQFTLILLWSRCMFKISIQYLDLSILHNTTRMNIRHSMG
jgi:hypothetical protein